MLCSPLQIIMGKERSRRQRGAGRAFGRIYRKKSTYRPCTDKGVALVQDTEQEDDARDDIEDDAASPITGIHLAYAG